MVNVGSNSRVYSIIYNLPDVLIISFLQWNDSIDNLPQVIQPRRRKLKWTSLEEETLRAGVKMYVLFLIWSNYKFLVNCHGYKLRLKLKVNQLSNSFILYLILSHLPYFLYRFGGGNWKAIRDFYSNIFENRSAVWNLFTKLLCLVTFWTHASNVIQICYFFRLISRTSGETCYADTNELFQHSYVYIKGYRSLHLSFKIVLLLMIYTCMNVFCLIFSVLRLWLYSSLWNWVHVFLCHSVLFLFWLVFCSIGFCLYFSLV